MNERTASRGGAELAREREGKGVEERERDGCKRAFASLPPVLPSLLLSFPHALPLTRSLCLTPSLREDSFEVNHGSNS